MAPLVNLGQPFGAPSRTFSIPAPAGIAQALAEQGRAFSQFGGAVGKLIGDRRQSKLESEDFDKISQIFNPQPQISNLDQSGAGIGAAFLSGQAPQGVQTQTPGVDLTSPQSMALLSSLQSNFGKQFAKKVATSQASQHFQQGDPFSLSPGQSRYDEQGRLIVSAPSAATPQGDPFTLSPGQTRYDEQGRPIASVAPKETTQAEREKARVALEAAKQDLKTKQLAYKNATSPEERENRKVEYQQARENLAKTQKEIAEIGQLKPTRADMKFYTQRGFSPQEAKTLRDSYIGVKVKEPQTAKEISTELSKWQSIQNKTREVGVLGQFGEIHDQETYDLAEKKIQELGSKIKKRSPYKEYPDAFMEDGVWKVIRKGKKYRIEG